MPVSEREVDSENDWRGELLDQRARGLSSTTRKAAERQGEQRANKLKMGRVYYSINQDGSPKEEQEHTEPVFKQGLFQSRKGPIA